ncbi:MAG TPA: DUF177 domain-containing protein [Clostridia bacterium]|nr:DUF177 domain-containing protein [Clostridia bacterium]
MYIRVKDLEIRKLNFDEQIQPGTIDFGADIRQVGVLRADGRVELVREHHGGREVVEDIRIVGKVSGRVETNCARCLDPVSHDVTRSFDLLYRPLNREKPSDEASISEAETEIGYYSGDGMELEDSLREQVLLSVPIKTVCGDDCKGLCPRCGKNLNQEACQCNDKPADPRWKALQDLRQKLQ